MQDRTIGFRTSFLRGERGEVVSTTIIIVTLIGFALILVGALTGTFSEWTDKI